MSGGLIQHTPAELQVMAEQVAKSRLFPGIDTPQAAFALMLVCQSEGIHPAQAMKRYHIIEGRPSMRADAMHAEFQRQGGRIDWNRSDAEECAATFWHPQHAAAGVVVRVTFAELDAAGVTRGKYGVKDNWRKFPRQMLRARVISEGVRMVLPGVVAGIYTPEEVEDFSKERAPSRRPEPAQPEIVADAETGEIVDAVVESISRGLPAPEPEPSRYVSQYELYKTWLLTEADTHGIDYRKAHNHLARKVCPNCTPNEVVENVGQRWSTDDGRTWLTGQFDAYLASLRQPATVAADAEIDADPDMPSVE